MASPGGLKCAAIDCVAWEVDVESLGAWEAVMSTPAQGLRQSFRQPMDLSRSKALRGLRPTFSPTKAFTDYVAELQGAW